MLHGTQAERRAAGQARKRAYLARMDLVAASTLDAETALAALDRAKGSADATVEALDRLYETAANAKWVAISAQFELTVAERDLEAAERAAEEEAERRRQERAEVDKVERAKAADKAKKQVGGSFYLILPHPTYILPHPTYILPHPTSAPRDAADCRLHPSP